MRFYWLLSFILLFYRCRFLLFWLFDKLWAELFWLLYSCVALWLWLTLWLHFHLPLTPWLSSSLFFLCLLAHFLIIFWSVPTPPSSIFFRFFFLPLISTMLLSLLFFLPSSLLILFLPLNIPRRFDVWMKEKSVPVINLLLDKFNQILFCFKGCDIKWRSVANYNILKVSDQFMTFDLLQ